MRYSFRRIELLLFSAVLVFPAILIAESFSGRLVGVSDGDTITVMHSGVGEKVRLNGIDAPEKAQAFGARAKEFVSSEAFGKTVTVKPKEKDKYGRTIGEVTLPSGESLNQKIVKNGYAWWYRKYAPTPLSSRIIRNRKPRPSVSLDLMVACMAMKKKE